MGQENGKTPIEIKGLRKAFGKQTVLNGIDLEVARGETLTVLGQSGSGKSVLLKLLIGLEKPDAGSVRIHGEDVTDVPREKLNEVRKKVGFLFQHAALYDSLSVEENVAFPLERHLDIPEQERRERARKLLSSLGMEQDMQKMPSEISGGMQKRVGLARALALDPEIVLFDEPTAGLDPITSTEIGNLIVKLKQERKITAIVVTHDLQNARIFSDRFALVHEGNIRAQGSFEDLQKSKDEFVARFLHDGSAACSDQG
jgi:phospholipid/cholesterol/gamma-HCH transport system ATP-binding protein